MVVAALQPWAEISERLRRIIYKFPLEALLSRFLTTPIFSQDGIGSSALLKQPFLDET